MMVNGLFEGLSALTTHKGGASELPVIPTFRPEAMLTVGVPLIPTPEPGARPKHAPTLGGPMLFPANRNIIHRETERRPGRRMT